MYPTYNQFQLQNLQDMRNRIDQQLAQIQQPLPPQNPAPITQNFQISPQTNTNDFDGKIASNIDDVKNTLAIKNTMFLNKEMSLLWFKDTMGNIKTYTLEEVVELDEKDKAILQLKEEIAMLKKEMNANESNNSNVDGKSSTKKSSNGSANKSNDE